MVLFLWRAKDSNALEFPTAGNDSVQSDTSLNPSSNIHNSPCMCYKSSTQQPNLPSRTRRVQTTQRVKGCARRLVLFVYRLSCLVPALICRCTQHTFCPDLSAPLIWSVDAFSLMCACVHVQLWEMYAFSLLQPVRDKHTECSHEAQQREYLS